MFGAPRFWTYASGVAELVSGGLLLLDEDQHIGAWVSAATIVAVYPANISMAMDAGTPNNPEAVAAWVRLPFQIPLVLWALSIAAGSPPPPPSPRRPEPWSSTSSPVTSPSWRSTPS